MCPKDDRERHRLFRVIKPLVLASKSPRRAELLKRLGLSFEIVPSQIAEPAPSGAKPTEYALSLALNKARDVRDRVGEKAILAADTIVVCQGHILGKPKDATQARAMLRLLSGRSHEVFTAYVILVGSKEISRVVGTKVYFKELSDEEIEAYLATGEPWDKAGAYAIQGIASYMVERVEGSVTNVIGLPLSETVKDLLKLGVIKWESPCKVRAKRD